MLGNETQSGEDQAHQARQALLTIQRQQLLSSCEHLVDKVTFSLCFFLSSLILVFKRMLVKKLVPHVTLK